MGTFTLSTDTGLFSEIIARSPTCRTLDQIFFSNGFMNASSSIDPIPSRVDSSEQNALFGADVTQKVMFVWYASLLPIPLSFPYSICDAYKTRHVQDEAENRYFTVRILGQERFGERRKRAFKVKVNVRVNAGKYQSLDQVRGEFPRLSIRSSWTGLRICTP